jgi:hypothetical protein
MMTLSKNELMEALALYLSKNTFRDQIVVDQIRLRTSDSTALEGGIEVEFRRLPSDSDGSVTDFLAKEIQEMRAMIRQMMEERRPRVEVTPFQQQQSALRIGMPQGLQGMMGGTVGSSGLDATIGGGVAQQAEEPGEGATSAELERAIRNSQRTGDPVRPRRIDTSDEKAPDPDPRF